MRPAKQFAEGGLYTSLGWALVRRKHAGSAPLCPACPLKDHEQTAFILYRIRLFHVPVRGSLQDSQVRWSAVARLYDPLESTRPVAQRGSSLEHDHLDTVSVYCGEMSHVRDMAT